MNIYKNELVMQRGSWLAWAVGYGALLLLFLSIYPAFSHDIAATKAIIEAFPKPVSDALGISMATFLSFLGFYIYIFTFLSLAAAVQASNLGLSLLSKEATAGMTDFLLTKPVSRRSIVMQKLAAALTILGASTVFVTLLGWLLGRVFGAGDYSLRSFLLIQGVFFMLQLCFFALGLAVSQVMVRVRSVVTVSLGMVFGFFVLYLLGGLLHDDAFRYLTPFHFFDMRDIVVQTRYQTYSLLLVAGTVMVPLAISYFAYTRRDVRAAA